MPNPNPIITESKSGLRRRFVGLPIWLWLVLGLVGLLGAIGFLASGGDDDVDEVETSATTDSQPSSNAPSTSEALATDLETTEPETTEPDTTAPMTTVPDTTTPATTAPATDPPTTPPATTAPATTLSPATTAPPVPGFGTGMQLVGQDIEPGRYVATGFEFCYWERLSGFSGETDDIITNDIPNIRSIVDIVATDVAFNSVDCGDWTLFSPGEMAATFGDGDWVVGQEIAPGQYTAEGAGDGTCYWERASGFTHDSEELIANDIPQGRAIVEIAPSDVRFSSRGCGTWTPL